jgi:hypothetical protein
VNVNVNEILTSVPPETVVPVPAVDLALLVADRRRWIWLCRELAHAMGIGFEEPTEAIDEMIRLAAIHARGKPPA